MKKAATLIVLDHPPEGARVRRADRLALIKDAGAAVHQRRVDNVGMADDPADVGAGPEGLARLDAVDRRHRPFERDDIAADVAHDALRHAGGAGGIENIERIGRGEIGAGRALSRRLRGVDQRRPVVVARLVHARLDLRALEDDAGSRLAGREADGEIEQRLVFDDTAGLDAAARGQDDFRLGVVDARRQLLGGEAAEHHRMHRADARAGEHGDDRLGDHRHVDQHPVARRNAEILEHGGERRRLVEQLAVGDGPLGRGDGAVVVERGLIAAARLDMAVERVVAGVAAGVGEPAAIDARLRIENRLRRAGPGDLARRLRPKGLRIGAPLVIGLPIAARHRSAPFAARPGRRSISAKCRASGARTQRRAGEDYGPVALGGPAIDDRTASSSRVSLTAKGLEG